MNHHSSKSWSEMKDYDDTMAISHYNMLPPIPRGIGIINMKLGVDYRLDKSQGKPMSIVPVYKRIDKDNVVTTTYRLI